MAVYHMWRRKIPRAKGPGNLAGNISNQERKRKENSLRKGQFVCREAYPRTSLTMAAASFTFAVMVSQSWALIRSPLTIQDPPAQKILSFAR